MLTRTLPGPKTGIKCTNKKKMHVKGNFKSVGEPPRSPFIGGIMYNFLSSNATRHRLARTIIQGIIGVIVANVDLLISPLHFDPATKAVIVALVMAVLSPIMSELANGEEIEDMGKDDVPHGFFEDEEEGGADHETDSKAGDEEGPEADRD